MNHLKRIAVAALAATALTALLGAGTASATTLEVKGVKQTGAVTIIASVKEGGSSLLRDTFGFSINTCTTSEMGVKTKTFTGASVTGDIGALSFDNCFESVTVHKNGTLHISHITGTTNGTVTSSGAEVTSDGPFGYVNCQTGAGTHLGTLTGSAASHATLTVNAVLSCSGISSRWTATYTVTSPTGLGVVA